MARSSEEKWEPLENLGASGQAVAKNIRRIRLLRGMAFTELHELLDRLGRDVSPWALRKIESGGRRVDADDLMAIAVALRVSPVTLLMPAQHDDDGKEVKAGDVIPISGWRVPISASLVWDWLTGERPLIASSGSNADDILDPERVGPTIDRLQFGRTAWPSWVYSEEVEAFEILRERLYEQAQDELTGKSQKRKRASQILREIRAERGEGRDGNG